MAQVLSSQGGSDGLVIIPTHPRLMSLRWPTFLMEIHGCHPQVSHTHQNWGVQSPNLAKLHPGKVLRVLLTDQMTRKQSKIIERKATSRILFVWVFRAALENAHIKIKPLVTQYHVVSNHN